MFTPANRVTIAITLSLSLSLDPATAARQANGSSPEPGDVKAAPVPEQIISAKKVFISNSGGGCNPFGKVGFSGGPDRAYQQFYEAMKSWGRYALAGAPAGADLAFEISFACPAAGPNVFEGKSLGAAYDPALKLVILDINTHIALWGINEHVRLALLQANRDKNFDQAMNALVEDLKHLAAGARPPARTVDKGQ